ncbi:hypothetical protein CDL15_Pgr018194 [Punica granatum]|uniref:PPM-type phosphatase domain-containing protein n=1 Tax=Punica granatum TaxID=22663 RepID=A0A218WIK1_PUNGR|nr:hypothetical protein CDL15_Pgr018194 [Punica granatum]
MGSCLSSEGGSPVPGSPLSPARGVRKKRNMKRSGSMSSPLDYPKDEPLHRIPGRLFLNGSTEVASLFTQQGKKGTNQDAMIVWENFCSRKDTVFCGVFDGHGPYGHMVAKRVRDSLPLKLFSHWEAKKSKENVLKEISLNAATGINSEGTTSGPSTEQSRVCCELEETEKQQETFQTLKQSFLKAFRGMDRELRMFTNIDCFCSGTTAVTLVKQLFLINGSTVYVRAIFLSLEMLGTPEQSWEHETKTIILMQFREAERIRKCKGRVFALQDEPEVARVWLPNNDSPGLAMARAFGDFCLKDFGLISVPEISCRRLTEKDEFVVLATDGIWDVLSNKEVVDIVASTSARSSAARALVQSAVRAWKYKYPTSKIDDCAVICLFLDSHNVSAASTTESREHVPSADQVETGGGVDTCVPTDQVDTSQMDSEKDWSAVEGVSRVDTLLKLPRFVPGRGEKRAPEEARSQQRP